MKKETRLMVFSAISGALAIILIFALLVATDSAWLYPLWKPAYVEVEENDTIAYDELEEPPYYFGENFGYITVYKLKRYMKENNLVITAGEYSLETTMRFEQLVKLLNFSTQEE